MGERETMMAWFLCLVLLGGVMMKKNSVNVDAAETTTDQKIPDSCKKDGVILPGCFTSRNPVPASSVLPSESNKHDRGCSKIHRCRDGN